MFAKIIFGTSSLGNLYSEISYKRKKAIVREIISRNPQRATFDSAGKYGAGLALEVLGSCLGELDVDPGNVQISNKLGWKRVPLEGSEPSFEPGVWANIQHDAVQDISYQGILDCYKQGNQLLGRYRTDIVSVHDPDEYLFAAKNKADKLLRQDNLLAAYQALSELKDKGLVSSVGVGAKDLSVIDFIADRVPLDWAMFANSLTPYTHKADVLNLIEKLTTRWVKIINSAVFNGGFLVGGDYLNYQRVTADSHPDAFRWREQFHNICAAFAVKPALACVQFSFLFDTIIGVALNTSSPARIVDNMALVDTPLPDGFWQEMQKQGLINATLQC